MGFCNGSLFLSLSSFLTSLFRRNLHKDYIRLEGSVWGLLTQQRSISVYPDPAYITYLGRSYFLDLDV